jgi:hypothetical protein
MPKQVFVELVGSVRNIQDDQFSDKEGKAVLMTRVKLLTGSIDTNDEAIHDINYIWKIGPNGRDVVRPEFLKDVVKGKVHKLPCRVSSATDVQVKGV